MFGIFNYFKMKDRIEELEESLVYMSSSYNETKRLIKTYDEALESAKRLIKRYESDIERIKNNQQSTQFSDSDLRRLLQLCHPDKHDGKQMAIDMTVKIQAMRK